MPLRPTFLALLLVGMGGCVTVPDDDPQVGADESEEADSSSDPLSTCDPLIQDCGEGMACALVASHFECTIEGSSSYGENCTNPDDCEAGFICGAFNLGECDSGFGCCTSFCEPGEGGCGSGMNCVSLFDGSPPPGVGPVGICVPEGA